MKVITWNVNNRLGVVSQQVQVIFLLVSLDGESSHWLHALPPGPWEGSILFLELPTPRCLCQSHPAHPFPLENTSWAHMIR
jgi:hypothetical protein